MYPPGKHSLKKDDYLVNMMLVPPKQRMRIHQFDAKTQEDAFTVSLEGLKGVRSKPYSLFPFGALSFSLVAIFTFRSLFTIALFYP